MRKENEIKYDKNTVPVTLQGEVRAVKGRLFKPRIDLKLCKKCMICIASCPDNSLEVSKTGNPSVNYSLCKGCLICLRECPYGAISEEKEV